LKKLDQISDCQIVKHWRKARRGELRLLATVWLKLDILWAKVRGPGHATFAVSSVDLE
jgi:hypothetical protein